METCKCKVHFQSVQLKNIRSLTAEPPEEPEHAPKAILCSCANERDASSLIAFAKHPTNLSTKVERRAAGPNLFKRAGRGDRTGFF